MTNFIEQYKIDKNLCDEILEYRKTRPSGEGLIANDIVDKSRKDSIDSSFNKSDLIYEKYISELDKCLIKYTNKYTVTSKRLTLLEDTNIQFYPPGGGFKVYHQELDRYQFPSDKRILVFMTYLNDVYIGGQTDFLFQKKSFRARKGRTLIWPTDWTHIHRGKVAPFEEKAIVTGWIHESNEINPT